VCEQLAQGCYLKSERPGLELIDLVSRKHNALADPSLSSPSLYSRAVCGAAIETDEPADDDDADVCIDTAGLQLACMR